MDLFHESLSPVKMPEKTPLLLCILVILLSTISSPQAQQTGSETNLSGDQPAAAPSSAFTRRYLVEVIVFNNLGPVSSDGEIWHRTAPINFTADAYAPAPLMQDTDLPESDGDDIRFTKLKALLPHLNKLHASPRYEVLTYVAWTQPLYQKRESFQVELIGSAQTDSMMQLQPLIPRMKGSLRLFENRLLFVDLDIENNIAAQTTSNLVGASTVQTGRPAGIYTLRNKRRVKLNELHYFDHPFFGALVRVSRWQPEDGS